VFAGDAGRVGALIRGPEPSLLIEGPNHHVQALTADVGSASRFDQPKTRRAPRSGRSHRPRGDLSRHHDQTGEEERACNCNYRDRQRPPGPWCFFVALEDFSHAHMLEVTDHDEHGSAEDDQHPNAAIEPSIRQHLRVRLHNQRDLRHHEAQPEQSDPGPKPREVGTVIRELVTHQPSQPSTEDRAQRPELELPDLDRPGTRWCSSGCSQAASLGEVTVAGGFDLGWGEVIELAVETFLVELKDPVRAKIERYELTRTIDPAHLVPTIGDDVTGFCEQFGVDWTRTAGKQAR
jgi:hypothetical protein